MKTKFIAVLTFVLFTFGALAQKDQDRSTLPVVPIEVVIKGKQSITSYLLLQVDHVTLRYGGASYVQDPRYGTYQELDRDYLRKNGYVTSGSFSQLSDALSGIGFSAEVVPTPEKYYDVWVGIQYLTADNRQALSGGGSLDIRRDNDTGELMVSEFQPWVYINPQVIIQFTNPVNSVKWVGGYGQEQYLETFYGEDGTMSAIIPVGLIEDGYLLTSDWSGDVGGWDLATGDLLSGERIFTVLGQSRSGDTYVVKNRLPDNAGQQFYQYQGSIYGEFPLTELVTDHLIHNQPLSIEVPVWGSSKKISPSKIFITPIGGVKEEELPWDENRFIFTAFPGVLYHIRMEFPGVRSWGSMGGKG